MHNDEIQLRRAAMDLLARREQSSHELANKLKRRSDSDQLIQSVISQLQADGLQSDFRFSEAFFRSLVARGIGPVRIRNEFRNRGVEKVLADEVISKLSESVNWYDLAESVVLKKYNTLVFDDEKSKAKCLRFLAYRGFSSEIAYDIVL